MSAYPLLNYNWIDANSNMLPIANSTFAYGTLGNSYNPNNENNDCEWNSLSIASLNSNNTQFITKNVDTYGINFNVSGVYQLNTNLLFSGSNFSSSATMYTFAFSYSTLRNTRNTSNVLICGSSTTAPYYNTINGPIYFLGGSTNTSLAANPLFINGSCSGGRGNYYNGLASTNYGGNVAAFQTSSSGPVAGTDNNCPPFFLLTNYSSGPGLNATSGNLLINTVNSMYYIPAGTSIYFNITNSQGTGAGNDNNLNATGNFTVQLLNYMP